MRILMTTMQLDIGGAETHIVELAKALSRKGAEVYVASSGGAYEKELSEAGIKHFNIPLNRKNPASMLKSFCLLKKIIKEYNFDIVHGHARIPSFICGKLHKTMHFPFVTTAHWVFNASFPFNYLSDWGQRSLSVSDDIKKYLVDSYGINEENILTTINGIDTEKFSKDTDFSSVKREFSLGEGKKRIVYVSRMDTDRSLVAHHLIKIAPELYKKFPDLEILIVGGGNDYNAISAEAKAANRKMSGKVIITAGARTDINKFVASGDVFVGVSRAALEAMAAEKPAIIAGNEGYIGIFDESKLKISIDTNFCCRGCEESTPERLLKDIEELFLSRDLEELGKYSREVIKSNYSVDTMAEDALKMYTSVLTGEKINETKALSPEEIEKYSLPYGRKIKNDIVVSGYYGFKNSGDDASLKAIVDGLKALSPKIRITVLSKNPAETRRLYGVDSVNRLNIFKIIKTMRNSLLLISGGGSLIQDVTSEKSLVYYLFIIRLAQFLNLKTMLYGNGIGPVLNEKSYPQIAKILNKVDRITLRDPKSLDTLLEIGVKNENTLVTADAVFSLSEKNFSWPWDRLSVMGLEKGQKYFCVSVRSWNDLADGFEETMAKTCDYIYKKYGYVPIFVPMQQSQDAEICQRIKDKTSCPSFVLGKSSSLKDVLGIVNGSEFVLGMRLHILIYAACAGVSVVGLDYDPKINNMMEYMGQKYFVPVNKVNEENLIPLIDNMLGSKDSLTESLEKIRRDLRKLADKNLEIAINLLKGGKNG
ncbi:MAG: polysaccharide pyruvyl transferase CsaB [Clostridia bacterium]|nr:polysaccharide pyruvyl transferase CsaB [Clostridia bacterium]